MRLLGRQRLNNFKLEHPDVVSIIDSWIQEVEDASWRMPHDIKDRYSTADFLGNKYVVINLKGNNYRLVFRVDYVRKIVVVNKIGTHSEYNKWNLK